MSATAAGLAIATLRAPWSPSSDSMGAKMIAGGGGGGGGGGGKATATGGRSGTSAATASNNGSTACAALRRPRSMGLTTINKARAARTTEPTSQAKERNKVCISGCCHQASKGTSGSFSTLKAAFIRLTESPRSR